MPTVSSTNAAGTYGTSATAGTTGGASGDDTKAKNEIDKDMFLRLLVTQLKYQDPLNPASPDEFLAQTAQFTAVEKLTELAAESTRSALGQRMATASALIGRAVTYGGPGGIDATGTVHSARITDTGEIMLDLGEGTELSLIEVKVIAQPAPPPATTPGATPTT
jgi:flagellar basal-body rod modification protein FlgD